MNEKYQPGDFVRLRSGGPTLTVTSQDQEIVSCVWFDGNNIQKGEFHELTLERVEDHEEKISKTEYLVETKFDIGLGPKFETLGIVEAYSIEEARELARQRGENHYSAKKNVKTWTTRIKPMKNEEF